MAIPSDKIPTSELANVCEQAARCGGAVLIDWRGRFKSYEKSRADLVTDADLASQEAIRRQIAGEFPNHRFVGEEDAHNGGATDDQYCWIVDPLDGTTNYVHGFPFFAVSVAVTFQQSILAGAIYDPLANSCYRAAYQQGAWNNKRQLHTSTSTSLTESLAAVSLPPQVEPDSPDLRSFAAIAQRARGIRRTGSCALNLAYLAAGQIDAFWAYSIHPWDVAAGVLLVREAGGCVSNVTGDEFDLWRADFAAACNAKLHQELLSSLNG